MNPSPMQFFLALVILAIPAAILQNGDRGAAWAYVVLVLLSFVVYQRAGLARFATFIQGAL